MTIAIEHTNRRPQVPGEETARNRRRVLLHFANLIEDGELEAPDVGRKVGDGDNSVTVEEILAHLFAGPDGTLDLEKVARGVLAALWSTSFHQEGHEEMLRYHLGPILVGLGNKLEEETSY